MKKSLGSMKTDFEDYFLMWDSVVFLPDQNVNNIPLFGHMGDGGVIPCHQHRACKALVKVESKYPPRVCPHCGVDTAVEFKQLPEETRELWLPSH